jgi:hypothetical protein
LLQHIEKALFCPHSTANRGRQCIQCRHDNGPYD